ncbi:MAG: YibE/F family protein [Anaerolineaceae bacterium]|nr:MAG: YibE/F family protein [Anaerolineaceae bacterium]
MKKFHILLIFSILILLLAAFAIWGVPYFFETPLPEAMSSPLGTGTAKAEVTAILEEGEITLGDTTQTYQLLRVRLLEGEFAGVPFDVDYGKRQIHPPGIRFDVGDVILVSLSQGPNGVVNAYFADYVRTPALGWLALAFALAIVVTGKWKGLRSLLGMAFSLFVIIGYIIPHILNGEDPVRVSIIGSVILLTVTLYLTYGWTLKTHASTIGMILILVLTGTLAWFAIQLTRLNGTGDEEALFLMQMSQVTINLRGLMLGGMIIGALGVLDDLVTTQSSAVFELHATDESLGFRELVSRAMRIGQDHVAATVNTLVLAYAGASLPTLLMFSLNRGDYLTLLNFEFIAEEVVRTLVGSLGLIAAVPLTTVIAAALALYSHRLGEWRHWLGPENAGGGHVH